MGTSSAFGWEGVTFMSEGAVMAVSVTQNMTLVGIQYSIGMMFSEGAAGAANVLANAVVMRYADWANWQHPNDKQNYIMLPGRNPFGPSQFVGQRQRPDGGSLLGGGFGGDDQLFSVIPKTLAPAAVNINTYVSLPNIPVVAGDGLFFHMDHMGAGPCDAEMQGTLFFERSSALRTMFTRPRAFLRRLLKKQSAPSYETVTTSHGTAFFGKKQSGPAGTK